MYSTREEWLTAAIQEVRPLFLVEGYPIADRIRAACGFPANHSRNGRIGECHASTASADQHYEVLISPVLDDPRQVLAVLVHELCHTRPGSMNHGVNFSRAALAMGLAPGAAGWKATTPGQSFDALYGQILSGLGQYPHAALSVASTKKQSTRMLKAVCPSCGYTIRLTKKWADQGLPICGLDGSSMTLTAE